MNLYKDSENDIIDDLKNENKYLKQKIKEYKDREEGHENKMDDVTYENNIMKRELEKMKKELIESRTTLEEIENNKIWELKEELKDANGIVEKFKSDDRELREQHEAALIKSLGQRDDVEKQFSRSKFISDQVIKSLKNENKKFKEEVVKIKEEKVISENNLHLVKEEKIKLEKQFKEEADNNLKEIYKLNLANKEKDVMLENLTEENEKCNKKVDIIKSEFNTVKTDPNMNSFSEKSHPLTLNEELKMSAEKNEFFECNYCEKTF